MFLERNFVWCLPILYLLLDMPDVDGFWHAWSKGAEEGPFRSYCRAGGPTTAVLDAFYCRGAVCIRRRRVGCSTRVLESGLSSGPLWASVYPGALGWLNKPRIFMASTNGFFMTLLSRCY